MAITFGGTGESSWIRPCNGGTDFLTEPGPYKWETDAEVSNGFATLHKTFYFTLKDLPQDSSFWDGNTIYEGERLRLLPRQIPPSEIMLAKGFPKKGEKLAEDERYHYTGNGTIRHISDDSRIWTFTAEYTSELKYDSDGRQEDDDTPPWKRKPTNVSVEFVEREEPFTMGYRNRDRVEPVYEIPKTGIVYQSPLRASIVRNAAGDPINARTTRARTQIRFTYCLEPKDFNVNDLIDCRGSVNEKAIKVIGLNLTKGQARLVDISPQYHDEYADGSFRKHWKYWEISVTMEASTKNDTFNQKLLNVGNRAFFHVDDMIYKANGVVVQGTGQKFRSRIVQWNSWGTDYGQAEGTPQYGSIALAMTAKKWYDLDMVRLNKKNEWPSFSYEEGNDIPLTKNGYVYKDAMNPASTSFGRYLVVEYPEYPWEDWSVLNLPQRGVDW